MRELVCTMWTCLYNDSDMICDPEWHFLKFLLIDNAYFDIRSYGMKLPCSKYLTKLSTEIMDRTDSSSAMMLLQYGGDDSEEENLNEQDNASGPTGRKTPEERKRRNSSKGGEPLTPSRRISEESFGKQAAALISDEEGDHHPPPIPDRWEPDMAQPLTVSSNTATIWALKFDFFFLLAVLSFIQVHFGHQRLGLKLWTVAGITGLEINLWK